MIFLILGYPIIIKIDPFKLNLIVLIRTYIIQHYII